MFEKIGELCFFSTVLFKSGTQGIQGPPGNLQLELHSFLCIMFVLHFYAI